MLLLLPPRLTPSTVLLQEAAEKQGWQVERLANWRAPAGVNLDAGVLAYGEPLFVSAMADALGLALIEPAFDWLAKLPFRYTKRQISFTTLGQARKIKRTIFAKPADDKCFPAAAYSCGADIKASSLLPSSIPVLISEVVDWEVEYRFFIRDRQIAASSVYLRHGHLVDCNGPDSDHGEQKQVTTFVESLLCDLEVDLPPAVVIDAGKIRERGWAILEANPVFGAGLYCCDPNAVLKVLAKSVVATKSLSPLDSKYVIERHE